MFMRLGFCGGALVGGALFWGAMSCAPSIDERTVTEEGTAVGDFCGGIAGIPCPKGFVCVDDPRDDCDPEQGGADCGGVCRRDTPGQNRCTGQEHGLRYISRDPETCRAILFDCPGHQEPFFNDCGCGCRPRGGACDYNDPTRRYVSQDPERCAAIRFFCAPGFTPFFDRCGCGCEQTP